MKPDWIHPEDEEYSRMRETIEALKRIALRLMSHLTGYKNDQNNIIALDALLSDEMREDK